MYKLFVLRIRFCMGDLTASESVPGSGWPLPDKKSNTMRVAKLRLCTMKALKHSSLRFCIVSTGGVDVLLSAEG